MRSKLVNTTPKTFVLVFDTGDEVMKGIENFCSENNIQSAGFNGIGAFSEVKLGYFRVKEKEYKSIPVQEQVEVLSLTGDVITYQGKPKIHAHAVVGKIDGTAHGGHLLSAVVNPTLEIVLTELAGYLHREMNDQYGIPLIKL